MVMTIEVELKEIKSLLTEVNKKLDCLLMEEKEISALMVLEDQALKDFLEKEPDIYTAKDIKAKVIGN